MLLLQIGCLIWILLTGRKSSNYFLLILATKYYVIIFRFILYDDMCHLGPFSQNPAILQMNPITRFFGTRHLAVDCLHFLNHKDKVPPQLLKI